MSVGESGMQAHIAFVDFNVPGLGIVLYWL